MSVKGSRNLNGIAARREIMRFIAEFIKVKGYPPTFREITAGAQLSSTSMTNYHLNVLVIDGYLSHDQKVSRSIRILKPFDAVPDVEPEVVDGKDHYGSLE